MHGACALSIIDLDVKLREQGATVQYHMVFNESLISRARNLLVHKFLESECTHMLFVDADIRFENEDVIRMLQSGLSIIGGLYCKKEILWDRISERVKEGIQPSLLKYHSSGTVFWPMDDFLDKKEHKIDEPLEVRYVGTGLMMIKREVFIDIIEHKPDHYYHHNDDKHYCFFDTIIENGIYLSEDYYFCNTWRKLGGKIHAAMWARTMHYGTMGLATDLKAMSER